MPAPQIPEGAGGPKPLLSLLVERAASAPDSPAFLVAAGDRYLSIPWRQFMRDVDAVARSMRDVYGAGSAVALLGENSYEWITCHLACLFAGVVVVPLDTSLSPAELAMRISFSNARLVVYSAQNRQKVREAERLAGRGTRFVGFGSRGAELFVKEGRRARASGAESLLDAVRAAIGTCAVQRKFMV